MLTFLRTKHSKCTKSHHLQRIVMTIDHHTHSTSCTANMRLMHYHVPGITHDVWKEICTWRYIFSGWWMRQGSMEWQPHNNVLNNMIFCAVLIFVLSHEHWVLQTRWNQFAQACKFMPKDADFCKKYICSIKSMPIFEAQVVKKRKTLQHATVKLIAQPLTSIYTALKFLVYDWGKSHYFLIIGASRKR